MTKEQSKRNDRWGGWPFPHWVLVALLVVMGVLAVLMSVASVRYDGSTALGELGRWALCLVFVFIGVQIQNWFHRRRRR